MTNREKIVIKILLIIAKIVSGDPVLQKELYHLSNHIAQAQDDDVRMVSSDD